VDQQLNLNEMGITQLSLSETTNVNGGETIAGGYDNKSFNAMANGVATAAGAVVGFLQGLFS
jgi:hypothetical protein